MTDRRPGKDRIEGKDKAPPCLLHEGCLHEESLLYKNKYRIPSARLQHWDYGWNAAYFVTICTHNRQCFFCEISNGKMELSEMGKTATIYWMEIPDHFPFVNLGAFVVMPNHIHGIVVIDKPQTVNAPIPDPVETRATIYYIRGSRQKRVFDLDLGQNSPDLTSNSPDLLSNSPDLLSNSPDLLSNSPDLKVILAQKLSEWCFSGMPRKLDANKMQELILLLCRVQWLTLAELSNLLVRDSKALQDQYLTQMVAEGKLRLRYTETLNHPKQAYGTKNDI